MCEDTHKLSQYSHCLSSSIESICFQNKTTDTMSVSEPCSQTRGSTWGITTKGGPKKAGKAKKVGEANTRI